jgi:hypothetical protein
MKLSCPELWCVQFVNRLTVPFCQGFWWPKCWPGIGKRIHRNWPESPGHDKIWQPSNRARQTLEHYQNIGCVCLVSLTLAVYMHTMGLFGLHKHILLLLRPMLISFWKRRALYYALAELGLLNLVNFPCSALTFIDIWTMLAHYPFLYTVDTIWRIIASRVCLLESPLALFCWYAF